MLKLGVIVSGGGTNLQNIIDGIDAGDYSCEIVSCVSTRSNAFALERCMRNDVPSSVMCKSDYPDYDEALIRHFKGAGAQLIVLAGAHIIVGERFIEAFNGNVINIHPSLLPSFGGKGFFGLNVHRAVLEAGVKVSGATAHFVTADIDAGPIITQRAVHVLEGDTPESLQTRVMDQAERRVLPRAIQLIAEGCVSLRHGKIERKQSVLVIGGGGREHAICKKLIESPKLAKLYCAPGNVGIAEIAEIKDIMSTDIEEIVKFAVSKEIDMVVVGPDDPLALGVVDALSDAGIAAFGPTATAARLESSKAYAKDFMTRHGIPTAKYRSFSDYESAMEHIGDMRFPLVVKADGLALGKGVTVCHRYDEAAAALAELFIKESFGEAGSVVVIEEYLDGREVTVLALVDGKSIVPLAASRDYKRAYNDNKGENTGGMGAICPVADYSRDYAKRCAEEIFERTLEGLKSDGVLYRGVLYFGLILTKDGPKVIEYNARFGDPEAQVVLARLDSDLLELFSSCICSNLRANDIKWKEEAAACVVVASEGYPSCPKTGFDISFPRLQPPNVTIYHAGTRFKDGRAVTTGGRVAGVTALAGSCSEALEAAYSTAERVKFTGAWYRTDIGS